MRSSTPSGSSGQTPWIFLLLCSALLAAGAVMLTLYHHHQHNRIIVSSSETLFANIAQRVQQNLNAVYRGPTQALGLLAHDPIWQAVTLEQRLGYLDKLSQILLDQPQLSSIYLSWTDGDFMLLRPLLELDLRERVSAPAQATWILWHNGTLGGERETEYRFYDDSMRLVEARLVAQSAFDPRERRWHELAIRNKGKGHIITEPYVFHFTSEFGTTVARAAEQGVVIGADITLDRLSTSLTGHSLPAASEFLLYNSQGTVVAYHDALRIRNTSHGSALRLRTFHELGSTLLARLAEDGYEIERHTRLSMEGQHWLVLQKRLSLPSLPETFLAILVPERELLEAAGDLRRRSLLVGLAGSLVLLMLFWLLAWATFRRRL